MIEDIYDPLDEYVNNFAPRFKQVAKDTFAQLSKEAGVDINANRQTCKQLYKAQGDLNSVRSKLSWTIFLCVVMWGSVIGGGIATYNMYDRLETWGIVLIVIGIVIALLLLFWKIHPLIKQLRGEQNELKEKTERLNALNIELNLNEKDTSVMDTEPEQTEEQPERKCASRER